MCLGCAVYINSKNNEEVEQSSQDYNNKTYGE
jgi:hypothetical protein